MKLMLQALRLEREVIIQAGTPGLLTSIEEYKGDKANK